MGLLLEVDEGAGGGGKEVVGRVDAGQVLQAQACPSSSDYWRRRNGNRTSKFRIKSSFNEQTTAFFGAFFKYIFDNLILYGLRNINDNKKYYLLATHRSIVFSKYEEMAEILNNWCLHKITFLRPGGGRSSWPPPAGWSSHPHHHPRSDLDSWGWWQCHGWNDRLIKDILTRSNYSCKY